MAGSLSKWVIQRGVFQFGLSEEALAVGATYYGVAQAELDFDHRLQLHAAAAKLPVLVACDYMGGLWCHLVACNGWHAGGFATGDPPHGAIPLRLVSDCLHLRWGLHTKHAA